MHVAHGGVGAQATGLGHQFAAQFGAVDGDAGRRHAGIRALVDLHLRNIQPAALKSRQICLRREPSSSRGQMTVSRDVPRRRPGRWRGPRRRGAGTSRRNAWRPPLQERRSGFANMRARAALGGRTRWTCANAGAADERRFWRFTLGRCPASRGLARWSGRTPGPWDTPQPVQQARQTECCVILLTAVSMQDRLSPESVFTKTAPGMDNGRNFTRVSTDGQHFGRVKGTKVESARIPPQRAALIRHGCRAMMARQPPSSDRSALRCPHA